MSGAGLSERLLAWYDRHGRHDLPWQHPRSAYRVWVSEVMLQQTQVATVIPYFERFVARFPGVRELADAPLDEVLRHWAGLGYYARARNLHAAAIAVRDQHGGELPVQLDVLMALPGIGRSTAGAILALAHGQRHPILDGNVKRVLARFHAVEGWPGKTDVARALWAHAEAHTPHRRVADYTQAIMDLGASLCSRSRPRCPDCPLQDDCSAFLAGTVARYPGSRARPARPRRTTRMLFIERDKGEILLLRRPPAGIWGGLWCLPEADDETAPTQWCESALGLSVRPIGQGPEIQHAFTHFELLIRSERLRLADETPGVMEAGQHLWYKIGHHDAPGLPAAVSKLIARTYGPGAQFSLLPGEQPER